MAKIKNEDLNRPSLEEFKVQVKTPMVMVLDNVRSANNVGSVFRTADAFGAEALYLCGITATPPNRDIEKTALGSTESVRWKHFPTSAEAIADLREKKFLIFAVEQAQERIFLNDFHPSGEHKYAFVFGHEVFGVDEKLLSLVDGCLEIPQVGTKHSLNVAVSAGIVAWDYFSKINNKKPL